MVCANEYKLNDYFGEIEEISECLKLKEETLVVSRDCGIIELDR